jgi:hypothetical protein
MKRAALICVLAMLGSLFVAAPASAHHRPSAWCSASGDVCLSARTDANGVRKLRIALTAKYFGHYKLCVKAPDDTTKCKRFAIEDTGIGYGDSVNWMNQFPFKGPGAYTATWRHAGEKVG